MMDRLYPHIQRVKSLVAENTLRLCNQEGCIIMMDRLYPHIQRVKNLVAENTLRLCNQEVGVLFFDVTTALF